MLLCVFAVVFLFLSAVQADNAVISLRFSPELTKKYPFSIALGSGLGFAGKSARGGSLFYAVTDSGPSFGEDCSEEIKNAVRNFKPLFGLIELYDGKAEVLWLKEIRSEKKIDPEGISIDAAGNLWIAEEEAPSLLRINVKTGGVLETVSPGHGLPKILRRKEQGAGFEGITITQSGKILATLQAPLDLKDSKSKLIRIIKYDPQKRSSIMYGYDLNTKRYKDVDEVKLSGLQAIDEDRFYVIERIQKKEKVKFSVLEIDFSGSTSISIKDKLGKELEFKKSPFGKKKKAASKKLVLRLENYSDYDKVEGIALFDAKQVVIINDNDFGQETNNNCMFKKTQTVLRLLSH